MTRNSSKSRKFSKPKERKSASVRVRVKARKRSNLQCRMSNTGWIMLMHLAAYSVSTSKMRRSRLSTVQQLTGLVCNLKSILTIH